MPVRLLLVDDHVVVRLGLRNLIAASRPEWVICGEAKDGAGAVDKVLDLAPDVVILDLAMPVMNGVEAATEIRRIAPATKIILYSAHDVPEFVWKSCTDGFVSKLARGNELVAAIERATGQKQNNAMQSDVKAMSKSAD